MPEASERRFSRTLPRSRCMASTSAAAAFLILNFICGGGAIGGHGPQWAHVIVSVGAGEGNRTLVVSLEGFCSTIELHPLAEREVAMPPTLARRQRRRTFRPSKACRHHGASLRR
jgi:hypothetical protein